MIRWTREAVSKTAGRIWFGKYGRIFLNFFITHYYLAIFATIRKKKLEAKKSIIHIIEKSTFFHQKLVIKQNLLFVIKNQTKYFQDMLHCRVVCSKF